MANLFLPVRVAFDLILPGMEGWDEQQQLATMKAYWEAQLAIDRLVHEEATFEEVGDILFDLGISPTDWLDTVEDNVNFLVLHG